MNVFATAQKILDLVGGRVGSDTSSLADFLLSGPAIRGLYEDISDFVTGLSLPTIGDITSGLPSLSDITDSIIDPVEEWITDNVYTPIIEAVSGIVEPIETWITENIYDPIVEQITITTTFLENLWLSLREDFAIKSVAKLNEITSILRGGSL